MKFVEQAIHSMVVIIIIVIIIITIVMLSLFSQLSPSTIDGQKAEPCGCSCVNSSNDASPNLKNEFQQDYYLDWK